MTGELLRTESLRKEFGGLVAVDSVDFVIPPDSIVSLIGPNGAGKTTFFNMLTGVYKPTAGRVIFGVRTSAGSLRTRSHSAESAARSRTSVSSRT